jgi:hypothetical protein
MEMVSLDRTLEMVRVAFKAEVERALEAQKVAFMAQMALQGKIWDSRRTHPGIIITNSHQTIKRELSTTNSNVALATINHPLTGTIF